ncbi:DUF883 family protein [Caulobacter segnis]|uniref:DUF883 domain-containing protein n=2 Tax=Caulobacter segnis TaxID=88688 RepID=D5VHZ8_CAUST|nr:DUF883 family protein [Caulobacter segnis]ADG09251.1 protein of unknown function DUF883 ElaB [Caulobacter segnis ATCC 21756]
MTDYSDSLTPTDNGFRQDLSNKADSARAKVEPKLKAVSGAAHEAYDSLKEVAAEAVGETRARVKDITAQAGDQFQRRYAELETWASVKPVRALGVAAGVGLVLGLLLRGRSTKTIYVRPQA